MAKEKINTITFLIVGLFLISTGVLLLIENFLTLSTLILISGCLFCIKGLIDFFNYIIKEEKRNIINIILSILHIIFGIICINNNSFVLTTVSRIFSIYFLFISITHLINYFIYLKYNIRGKLICIIKFIILFVLSISLLLKPIINAKYLSIILSIYLILYGINAITNFLSEIIPLKTKNKVKRSINIQLPILFTAFIPPRLTRYINELLETEEENKFNSKKKNLTSDLEVLIHLAPNGSAAMGHVEISFKNKVYSYGNYDRHSRSLFDSIGDGVILIANKQKYIKYCIEKRERYIIEFGISLTDYEKEIVEERINKLINSNTIDYLSDKQLAEKGLIPNREFHDMSSEIYLEADGQYKKITSGKYKKFFVLKNNCAMVAQYILSSVGKEILAINGIISPGAYYNYLNKRFMMKNTNVISRKIYIKEKKAN